MRMQKFGVVIAGVVIAVALAFCGSSAASAPQDGRISAAKVAAQTWLRIVDSGSYGRSWLQAASLFRGAVPEDTWRMQLTGVRKPLGKVIRRELIDARYMGSMPGAPDGDYVVIRYRTRFDRRASAVETVTPMKDVDGVWRVSGYYIR